MRTEYAGREENEANTEENRRGTCVVPERQREKLPSPWCQPVSSSVRLKTG